MAEESSAVSGAKGALTKRYGPLPAWGWGVAIVGGVAVLFIGSRLGNPGASDSAYYAGTPLPSGSLDGSGQTDSESVSDSPFDIARFMGAMQTAIRESVREGVFSGLTIFEANRPITHVDDAGSTVPRHGEGSPSHPEGTGPSGYLDRAPQIPMSPAQAGAGIGRIVDGTHYVPLADASYFGAGGLAGYVERHGSIDAANAALRQAIADQQAANLAKREARKN